MDSAHTKNCYYHHFLKSSTTISSGRPLSLSTSHQCEDEKMERSSPTTPCTEQLLHTATGSVRGWRRPPGKGEPLAWWAGPPQVSLTLCVRIPWTADQAPWQGPRASVLGGLYPSGRDINLEDNSIEKVFTESPLGIAECLLPGWE